jgi:hypothetical protein
MEREMPDVPDPELGGSPEEALRRLERRLDVASEAAERLIAEAAAQAAAGAGGLRGATGPGGAGGPGPAGAGGGPSKPPPAGWQTPPGPSAEPESSASELDLLMQLVRSLRELIPPELQQRLAAAVREVLLAIRALIDWYLERIEHRREESVEVQDIPIL